MAGHSQFKNIMHRKGAQDSKRAKIFTKLIRELTVAAKQGIPDPAINPRLRAAIIAARGANLPKDTMDRAILRGSGPDTNENFEEIRYEGYGVDGVAIIIEALTDNRNRTAPEIRAAFNKNGGSLAEPNSVSFQFSHMGLIEYPLSVGTIDTLLDLAIDAGAEDVEQSNDRHLIYCADTDLHKVREKLFEHLRDPVSAKFIWKPLNPISIKEESQESLIKLLDALEDNDDVQAVFHNII